MKKVLFSSIILYIGIIVGLAQEAATIKSDTVKYAKAPNFTLRSTDNKAITLDSLLKKGPVYLECWDLPCKNCIKQLDALMPIYDSLKDYGLQIVALSVDKPADETKVKALVKAKKWPYYILLDNKGKVKELYQITIKPTAYLINQKGEIVYTHIGFKPGDEKKIKTEILKWLPVKPTGAKEKSKIQATPKEK